MIYPRFRASLSLIILALAVQLARAQDTVLIPSQFHTARTAFLAAAGTSSLGPAKGDVQNRIYAAISAAVARTYELKASPAQAELSMRMSIESTFGSVSSGSNQSFFYLRLSIYDTKTGMLLWVLDEQVDPALREQNALRNLELSATKLAVDLQTLAAGQSPNDGPKPSAKTRFQQDKP